LDHHIRDKHSLLLKYALTNNRETGDAFNTGGLVDPSGRGSSFIEDHGIAGSLISVLSNNFLNSARFQVSTRRAVLRTADQIGRKSVSLVSSILVARTTEMTRGEKTTTS
jgi:hypothetical protein